MLKILQFLFGGCPHRWRIHRKVRLYKEGQEMSFGTKYIMQCEKCGKMDLWIYK